MNDDAITCNKGFRLTKYRCGSLQELWSISWPLMLATFSGTIMTFIDRAVLARYQSAAFDACSAAQPWYWALEGILMSFVVCTEILIGRFNGASLHKKIGPAVWQMVAISLLSLLIIIPIACNARFLLADNIEALGAPYLRLLLLTLPFEIAAFGAIGAFFVGRGDTKEIPLVLFTTSCINCICDIWFVFGGLGLPSLGIIGAALATNVSQITSFLIFLILFLRKKYREKYAINKFCWSWDLLKQCIRIGMPNAISYGIICGGWCLCFQFFSNELPHAYYKAYCVAFTIYNFMFFVMDGLGKGVGTLCSNFLGARQEYFLGQVLKQSCFLTITFAIFFCILLTFSGPIICFLAPDDYQTNIAFTNQLAMFLKWYCVIFSFETLSYCIQGFLLALMQIKVVLCVKILFYWGLCLIPTYFLIVYGKCNPIVYMKLYCIQNVLILVIFYLWYRKKTWYKPI